MTRILVLYYSSYGHVRALAQAEAEGARSVPGTHVDLRRVPETVPDEIRQNAGFAADETPVASPADLEAYDAIIFGTPTLFGMMAGQMKSFLDQAGGLWGAKCACGQGCGCLRLDRVTAWRSRGDFAVHANPASAFRHGDCRDALHLCWSEVGRGNRGWLALWRGHDSRGRWLARTIRDRP